MTKYYTPTGRVITIPAGEKWYTPGGLVAQEDAIVAPSGEPLAAFTSQIQFALRTENR